MAVAKTYSKITKRFYWPQIGHCGVEFCKTYHICQMVMKPNQNIPVAPLKPVPAFEEPFGKVIIDCVGPLPKTKSRNQSFNHYVCLNQISRGHTFDQLNSSQNLKSSGQFLYFSWLTKRDPVRSRVKFYVRTNSTGCISARCKTDQI